MRTHTETKTIDMYNGKTFTEMTDTEKQDLATILIEREFGHCFSNVFTTLFQAIDDSHIEYEDMYNLSGSYDYETAVTEHIDSEITLSELHDLINEYAESSIDEFHNILCEQFINYINDSSSESRGLSLAIEDLMLNYCEADESLECGDFEDYADHILRVKLSAIEYVNNITLISNLIDWIETTSDVDGKIGINLDKFTRLIINGMYDDDMEKYSNENDLDPNWDEAYEHWIVSSWLSDKLQNTGDVCGLTIWARYTTGQAICLDTMIQKLAFDVYSEPVEIEPEMITVEHAKNALVELSTNSVYFQAVKDIVINGESFSDVMRKDCNSTLSDSTLKRHVKKAAEALLLIEHE